MATKSSAAKLAYMAQYQKQPENVDKRVDRNRARRQALAEGIVKKGDKKEIDHKVMLDAGGSGAKSNTRVVSEAQNASWRARQPGVYGKNKK
jgi:hypothetical protein